MFTEIKESIVNLSNEHPYVLGFLIGLIIGIPAVIVWACWARNK